MRRVPLVAFLIPALLMPALALLTACGESDPGEADEGALEIVAESQRQWTGVAVSPTGRIFVNYPRWSDEVPISVAEIENGKPVAYPDASWNSWAPDQDPAKKFVCVQSVTFDDRGTLWVLDPANPGFAGVVEGGPKLLAFNPDRDVPSRIFRFAAPVIKPGSYLNDVRVDTEQQVAYITDSGDGALVVLDLNSGLSRRVLDDHPATGAEAIDITIEGTAWKRDGQTPQVHADGIALSPDRAWVYFQALTGRTMYRVATEHLRNKSLPASDLAKHVEKVAESGASDGLVFDKDGNLYLSSLEENAINRLTPEHKRERVVADERLAWPDSFALGQDGWIYVTTALIHRGAEPGDPYRIWRFKAP